MDWSLFFATIVAAGCLLGPAAAFAADTLKSPVVHPDRRITFCLQAPNASSVSLKSGLVYGQKAMTKGKGGVWSLTVGPAEPGIYNYSFVVDGMTLCDPLNAYTKFWESLSSLVEVPGTPPRVYELQDVPHGTIHTHYYHSKALGITRAMTVYTPPGYEKHKSVKYPVLYLLHGLGDTETVWVTEGRAARIADNLLARQAMLPMIIVMPYGHARFPGDEAPNRQRQNAAFCADLLGDIIPFMEAHYHVCTAARHRAIAGLSMGGGQALTLGLNHLDYFTWIGGFSAAIPRGTFKENFATFESNVEQLRNKIRLLWIGCGKKDELIAGNRDFSGWLKQRNVNHLYQETPGWHEWAVWREYLPEFLPLLFRTAPKKGA